jgi:hypothetical protein
MIFRNTITFNNEVENKNQLKLLRLKSREKCIFF